MEGQLIAEALTVTFKSVALYGALFVAVLLLIKMVANPKLGMNVLKFGLFLIAWFIYFWIVLFKGIAKPLKRSYKKAWRLFWEDKMVLTNEIRKY